MSHSAYLQRLYTKHREAVILAAMKCPACKTEFKPTKKQLAKALGSFGGKKKTPAKAAASKANGAKGGRPKKKSENTSS